LPSVHQPPVSGERSAAPVIGGAYLIQGTAAREWLNGNRAAKIARARELLAGPPRSKVSETPKAT